MDYKERGEGSKNIKFELSENTMGAHVSEFPVGTYKKAHRHGPGANVVILRGKAYTGAEDVKKGWKPDRVRGRRSQGKGDFRKGIGQRRGFLPDAQSGNK